MTETAAPRPVEQLTYEAALAELENVVSRLERGDVPLEESIGLYERGAALRTRCEQLLSAAELKVAQIARDSEGALSATPLPDGGR